MMMNTRPDNQPFREGDEVVLAQGTYPGTTGVFLHFHEDAKWANITERNGQVSCHPVQWMAHCQPTTPVSVN